MDIIMKFCKEEESPKIASSLQILESYKLNAEEFINTELLVQCDFTYLT